MIDSALDSALNAGHWHGAGAQYSGSSGQKNMRPMRLFLLLVMAHCDDAPLTLTIRSPDESGALVPQTAFSFNISSDFDDLQELADDYMLRQPTISRGSKCDDDDEGARRACLARAIAHEAVLVLVRARAEACCGADSPPDVCVAAREAEAARVARRGYTFSSYWGHAMHHCNWRHLLRNAWRERAARPLRALEIGVWEGRTATWLLDDVLVHPRARWVGVDFAPPSALEANLRAAAVGSADACPAATGSADACAGSAARTRLLREPSETALPKLLHELNSARSWARDGVDAGACFDLVYVDGDHSRAGALFDMVLAWRLLARDGLMVVDDVAAFAETVGAAADAFIGMHREELRVAWRDQQLALRKIAQTTPFGLPHAAVSSGE